MNLKVQPTRILELQLRCAEAERLTGAQTACLALLLLLLLLSGGLSDRSLRYVYPYDSKIWPWVWCMSVRCKVILHTYTGVHS